MNRLISYSLTALMVLLFSGLIWGQQGDSEPVLKQESPEAVQQENPETIQKEDVKAPAQEGSEDLETLDQQEDLEMVPQQETPEVPMQRLSRVNLSFRAGNLLSCQLGKVKVGEEIVIDLQLEALGETLGFSSFDPTLSTNELLATRSELNPIDSSAENSYEYSLSIKNLSDEDINHVSVVESLPPESKLIRSSSSQGKCELEHKEADEVLLVHPLPQGGVYREGSSKLNNQDIPDPLIVEDGKLYWLLPYQAEGTLSYLVNQERELAEVISPSVSIRKGKKEYLISGDTSFRDYRLAQGLEDTEEGFYQVQASITLHLTDGDWQSEAFARGFLESPLQGGQLQAAVDVATDFDEVDTERDLQTEVDPTGDFPLTGSGGEARPALRSDDGVAVLFDHEKFSVGYYSGALALPGVRGLPRSTALQAEVRDIVTIKGSVGLLPEDSLNEEIIPDGTRRYKVKNSVAKGTEKITLIETGKETQLRRLIDYTIDYDLGIITLAEPLWPTYDDFNPVRLEVSYSPENSPRELVAFGVGAEYIDGPWKLSAGVAKVEDVQAGAAVSYQTSEFSVNAHYTYDNADESSRFGVSGRGTVGLLEANADITYREELSVRGRARLAYPLIYNGKIALEHEGSLDKNRSGLLYEQSFGNFSVGAGLGYVWEDEELNALLRGRYSNDYSRIELTHAQPFDFDKNPNTSLKASYEITSDLSAEANASYIWDEDFEGTVGLNQRLGKTNLTFRYALPEASGEGNEARFGVNSPFDITDDFSVHLNAGYDYSFADDEHQGAVGAAGRYHLDGLSATAGIEVALLANGDTKTVIRGGAAGSITDEQVVSFDANYQFSPDEEGRYTLAYALRMSQLSLLTYHRLEGSSEKLLEGQVAANYHPISVFQVRPKLVYQVNLDDSDSQTYQASLGGIYYTNPIQLSKSFAPSFGFGGVAHYMWQPVTESTDWALSAEASAKLIDQIWVTAGYTFHGFTGLTSETTSGPYFRLDLFSGQRFSF